MSRILVHPDRLRLLAEQWKRSAAEMRALLDRLDKTVDRLDGVILQDASTEADWERARGLADRLADQSDTYSRSLAARADRFEEADGSGAAAVSRVSEGFAPALRRWKEWWDDAQQPLVLPRPLVDRLLSLGGSASGAPSLTAASLSGLAELATQSPGGLGSPQPLSPTWQGEPGPAGRDTLSRAPDRGEGGEQDTEIQKGG